MLDRMSFFLNSSGLARYVGLTLKILNYLVSPDASGLGKFDSKGPAIVVDPLVVGDGLVRPLEVLTKHDCQ
jgi:hypothetical protein